MEAWARGPLGGRADFLCICVDERAVAEMFGRMFEFTSCVNGWIPSQADMPSYGQLGCSGFILVNGDGSFVSKRTSAFLQQGEGAFRDLEQRLLPLLAPPQTEATSIERAPQPLHASYPYAVGCVAVVDGLRGAPELNGRKCTVLAFDTASGRFNVELIELEEHDKGGGIETPPPRRIAVLPCSLAPWDNQTEKQRVEGAEKGVIQAGIAGGAPIWGPDSVEEEPESGLAAIDAPASVGVSSLDEEHEHCADAINALLAACPPPALATPLAPAAGNSPASEDEGWPMGSLLVSAVDALEDHFAHEEALLRDHRALGAHDGAFSALDSHCADHARILALGRAELSHRAEKAKRSNEASAQEGGGRWQGVRVDPRVARKLAAAFVTHADKFDRLFEGRIPASAV